MKKYTWEYNIDAENWMHDIFDTKEECLEDYLANYIDEWVVKSIAVAEVKEWDVRIDGLGVIENLQDYAHIECDENAEGWEPTQIKDFDSWNELDKQLTDVVKKWLEKNNAMPDFYTLTYIEEVETGL